MNIQAQLFKQYNKVKYNAEHWAKELEKSNEKMLKGEIATEADGEIFYNATFFAGAQFFGKIFLNTYQGDFNDKEAEHWLKVLDNPEGKAVS